MAKWVYMFTEGNANMRNLLGGKGANLAEMTNLGLPVPQGFTITTEACTQYYEDGRQINDEIMAQIMEAITKMEGVTRILWKIILPSVRAYLWAGRKNCGLVATFRGII